MAVSSNHGKIYDMVLIGVMTALICVLAPLSIPIQAVPISLGTLMIFLTVYVLGCFRGTTAVCIYILLGLVGLPVFAGYTGGAAKLLGPTGGYIIGYIPMALIAGFFFDHFPGKRVMAVVGMAIGMVVLYLFGTVWLALQMSYTFYQALWAGVIPYLIGDAIKIVIVVLIGPVLKGLIEKARIQSGRE